MGNILCGYLEENYFLKWHKIEVGCRCSVLCVYLRYDLNRSYQTSLVNSLWCFTNLASYSLRVWISWYDLEYLMSVSHVYFDNCFSVVLSVIKVNMFSVSYCFYFYGIIRYDQRRLVCKFDMVENSLFHCFQFSVWICIWINLNIAQ